MLSDDFFNPVFETLLTLFDHTLAIPVSSVKAHKLGSLSCNSCSISLNSILFYVNDLSAGSYNFVVTRVGLFDNDKSGFFLNGI